MTMDNKATEVVLRTAIRNMEVQQVQIARLLPDDIDEKIKAAIGYMNFAMDALKDFSVESEIKLNNGGMTT